MISYVILSAWDLEKPLLYDFSSTSTQRSLPADTLLGWTHDKDQIKNSEWKYTSGCILFTDSSKTNSKKIKIVVSGGSTSDNFFLDHNWPKALFYRFLESGYSIDIYNGAVAGYGTTQELLKLKRDVLPLNPDIFITYNGVNEYIYIYPHWVLKTAIQKFFQIFFK